MSKVKVTFAVPVTTADGKRRNPNATAPIPFQEARELIHRGHARHFEPHKSADTESAESGKSSAGEQEDEGNKP